MFKVGNRILGTKPLVMGVINISPESFYSSSVAKTSSKIVEMAEKHIAEGADFIDIGAQSTAPISVYGKDNVIDTQTELQRVLEAIQALKDYDILEKVDISIDTQRQVVADKALNEGATIINDISGFKKEPSIAKTIADHDASAIAMAACEKPGDVWKIPDIISELQQSIKIAENAGIDSQKIVVDPGIGSWNGRDFKHDYTILRKFTELLILKKPILVGISRKSFIGKILDASPNERLFGSIAATCWALERGAMIIRTHDTKPIVDLIKILEQLGAFST